MKLTAELSLYPLQDDYLAVIQGFIDKLAQHPDLVIVTNAMSTQVNGDYERVFDAVKSALADSYDRHGKQVLVCKFIVGDLDIDG